MSDLFQQLSSAAGLISLGYGALVSWVALKMRADMGELRSDLKNQFRDREELLLKKVEAIFLRKPELTDDYPLTRREFDDHKEEDRNLHRQIDAAHERYNMRFRTIEAQVTHLEVSKQDRRGFDGPHGRRITGGSGSGEPHSP